MFPYKRVYGSSGKLLHRDIMEQHIGRPLADNEVVHHINGDTFDNRIENLQLMTNKEHSILHGKSRQPKTIEVTCNYCGKSVIKLLRDIKYQTKVGRNKFYCNKKCKGLHEVITHIDRTISIEKQEIIKKEHENGLSGYAIAKKHNLNKKTVYTYIRKLEE